MQSKFLMAAAAVAFTTLGATLHAQERPKITGISHLAVYTSDPAATDHYYREIVGARKEADPENPQGVKYAFSETQYVEVLPLPANAGVNRMDHAAFNTTNAEAMRKYLAAKGWKTPPSVTKGSDGGRWFEVVDPEGNRIQFVQPELKPTEMPENPNLVGRHIIHVGFLVHSREAEDKFYRGLLGFNPYWFGGMVEGKIDWVSQQVPDGHDWLEYMLTSGPSGSGIPANISQNQLGVLDHLSIGEDSVPEEYKKIEARLGNSRHDQGPKIGKDGKYQFNMYDPDGIRLELMNFHATDKPCCSPFTAQDPAE